MKQRAPEAQILESDYIKRLKDTLAGKDPALANEIMQSIREHIEEAINESPNEEISAAQMANILEKLGSPEAYINEYFSLSEGKQNSVKDTSKDTNITIEDSNKYYNFLSKLWVAYLIGVVGLYIPIIAFYFCTIIYLVFLVVIFKSSGLKQNKNSNNIIVLSIMQISFLAILCVASIFEIKISLFSIATLPLSITVLIISLIIDWKVLGEVSNILKIHKNDKLAEYVEDARKTYIYSSVTIYLILNTIFIILSFSLGWTNKPNIYKLEIIQSIFMLPIGWIIGWLFLLQPISKAKQAIDPGSSLQEREQVNNDIKESRIIGSNDLSDKKRLLSTLLCFFFGVFGAHRFYAGKIGTGILWLCTIGFLGVGAFIDLIIILFGEFKDNNKKKIIIWV